ncbi:HNH endonuclease [bacterium]|nr:HNH endonuclease [bacterium]
MQYTNKTYIDDKGYERFKDTGKFVHRWIVGKIIGRSLKPTEVIHHINRNKSDNRLSNLWLFDSQQAHDQAHRVDAYKYGRKASYQGF